MQFDSLNIFYKTVMSRLFLHKKQVDFVIVYGVNILLLIYEVMSSARKFNFNFILLQYILHFPFELPK